jgi:hypothetical protein
MISDHGDCHRVTLFNKSEAQEQYDKWKVEGNPLSLMMFENEHVQKRYFQHEVSESRFGEI